MRTPRERRRLAESICSRDDLSTDDPYDVWKTATGFRVKDFYNRHRVLGLGPAAALTLYDAYLNGARRAGYRAQEYPIVRAWAALVLLNLHAQDPGADLLATARRHLEWLRDHATCSGAGLGWGIGFRQPILKDLVYEADRPLATMTPYALEALVRYQEVTGDVGFVPIIHAVYRFLDADLVAMEETDEILLPSYSNRRDRRVVNVASYVLNSYARLLPYLTEPELSRARRKMDKLYRYLELSQRPDGSWLYSPDGKPFIDCFHSCIVLRNVVKADRAVGLPGAARIVARGYEFVTRNFRDSRTGLFRRFALRNKPSLVRFDLYDNAEVIHLACLVGDTATAESVNAAVEEHFVRADDIYSQVDCFGILHNRNTLRWAVMPYLYAVSLLPRR